MSYKHPIKILKESIETCLDLIKPIGIFKESFKEHSREG